MWDTFEVPSSGTPSAACLSSAATRWVVSISVPNCPSHLPAVSSVVPYALCTTGCGCFNISIASILTAASIVGSHFILGFQT